MAAKKAAAKKAAPATKAAPRKRAPRKRAAKKAAAPGPVLPDKIVYPNSDPDALPAAEELIVDPDPENPHGLSAAQQGFAVGPKEQGPAERVLPDVVGTVTLPGELPNMIDSSGVDTVVVDGKRYPRAAVEAALVELDD